MRNAPLTGGSEVGVQQWRNVMFEGLLRPMHLLLIVIIALLFFGPSKLAGLGKGLGDAIKNFKGALKEDPPETPAQPTDKPKE